MVEYVLHHLAFAVNLVIKQKQKTTDMAIGNIAKL